MQLVNILRYADPEILSLRQFMILTKNPLFCVVVRVATRQKHAIFGPQMTLLQIRVRVVQLVATH